MPAPLPQREDDDLLLRRRLVRLAGGALALVGGLLALLLQLDGQSPPLHVLIHLALAALGLSVLALDRARRHLAAARLMVWGMWALCSLVAATNGGVRGPNLLNYPVLVIFAGWLLGSRTTWWLVGVSGLFMLGLVAVDGQGLIPPANFDNRLAYGAYLCGVLLATAGLTVMARHSFLERLAREQAVVATLAARDAQLRTLSLAVEQSPEGVLITDLQARIEYVNEALLRHSGFAREELLGRPARVLGSGMTPPERFADMWTALRDGRSWRGELVNRRKDGSHYTESAWIAPIRQADGGISHYLCVKQDLSARQAADARIRQLAWQDSLTGLANRSLLMSRLAEVLRDSQLARGHAGLLLLNIDRFKTVNEARGQEAGDALLTALAERLGAVCAPGTLLARVSADEFALVLTPLDTQPAAAHHEAAACANGLHAALLAPLALPGVGEVTVTVSIGVALGPQGAEDSATEFLRRATTALHQAKAAGGGETAFFETVMGEAAQRRFRIERDLREALAVGQLQLYLQPQVDAQGHWVAAEALVRWLHPEQGMVPPAVFVPVAEETDLIIGLGRWVFHEACTLLARETMAGRPLRLSVNLSPRQFRQPDFVSWFRDLLARTGADPSQLTLEITEGLVIDKVDEVVARMRELNALGVHFSVDDFGTGYSSLAYLKRLPIDELKIDKTFVQDAPRHGDDAALVETILSVARHMRLQVVAEGVETPEQAAFLAARAHDVIYQGYLFGKPEPAETWLARRQAGELRFPSALPAA